MGVYGEGHPGQARQQGPVGCARVSRRQGLHQDRCAHYAFFMTISVAAQDGWDYNVFDAQSAYLQSDGIERLLLLRMPHKNQPPGTKPGQVFVATGSICGTRDAGRAWHEHIKKVLEVAGSPESRLEQGLHYLHGPSGLEAVAHTHVDDFLIAFKKASCARAPLETIVGHGRVLWSDHLQGWQSHQGDAGQVNAEP